jgi:hypothetical protein
MANRFTAGKRAIAECDRCGIRIKLEDLKKLIIKTKQVAIKVCNECWEPDQPQLQLGMYPISDPQAVRDPRPDFNAYYSSGVTADDSIGGGSRVFQWGWNPVGGASSFDNGLTPNDLVATGYVGTVAVTTA